MIMSKLMPNTAHNFTPSETPFLHVAVGVIKNTHGDVLISQRAAHVHQGGLWEFPGGKVETGESPYQALQRELLEELNLQVLCAQPLIQVRHHYPDISVLLDVWLVESFTGNIHGCEGQAIRWVCVDNLQHYAFPAANLPIIQAASMPRCYAILQEADLPTLQTQLQHLLRQGIGLIQARFKTLSAIQVLDFMAFALPLCKTYHATLLLNSTTHTPTTPCDGVHFTSADLMRLQERPPFAGRFGASCHNLAQLQHAQKIGLDFAVLAPVLKTLTHPDAQPLGWENFAHLVVQVNLPVYALGGVNLADNEMAWHCGGQGIAGIRAFY